jgi:hypothetical protein
MCSKSETLWVEYFRFELLYASHLRARRVVLGIQGKGDETEKDEEEQAGPEASDQAEEGMEKPPEGEAGAIEALLRGRIAAAVLDAARAAFPGSLSLQRRMLLVLDEFEFEGKEDMENSLLQSVREASSGGEAQSWDFLARRAVARARRNGAKSPTDAGVDVFEEAVAVSPTAAVYGAYSVFLKEHLEKAMVGAAEDRSSS